MSQKTGVALRRVDEARKWRRARKKRDEERDRLARTQRRAWRKLYEH